MPVDGLIWLSTRAATVSNLESAGPLPCLLARPWVVPGGPTLAGSGTMTTPVDPIPGPGAVRDEALWFLNTARMGLADDDSVGELWAQVYGVLGTGGDTIDVEALTKLLVARSLAGTFLVGELARDIAEKVGLEVGEVFDQLQTQAADWPEDLTPPG